MMRKTLFFLSLFLYGISNLYSQSPAHWLVVRRVYSFLLSTTFTVIAAMTLNLCAGQSRRELLQLADASFNNGNYAGAAFFYGKIVGGIESGDEEIIYPGDLTPWTKPPALQSAGDSALPGVADSAGRATNPGKNNQSPEHDVIFEYALYRYAESFYCAHDNINAEKNWERALPVDSAKYPLTRFYYASSLKKNMKYLQAISEFEKFIKTHPGKTGNQELQNHLRMAMTETAGCKFALKALGSARKGINIVLMDSAVNAGSFSFGASFFNNDTSLIFASGQSASAKTSPGSDLYISEKESAWSAPRKLASAINSSLDEGAAVLTSDRTQIFFTRCTGNNECFIYLSRYLSGQWLQPVKLNDNVNISGYRNEHPALSPDNNILYFASDRPGGFGRMDIWYCAIDESGNAGPVNNAGGKINSPGDEITPFYHAGGNMLYFSSDGHPGLGGLDIFAAEGAENKWYDADNLGFPVNSSRDDLYFIVNENSKVAYLTSERHSCSDCSAGNCCKIYRIVYEPLRIHVRGYVYNKTTKETIPNSLVTLNDMDETIEPFFVITDENGFYSTPLRRNLKYGMKAQKIRFFADTSSVSTVGLDTTSWLERNFYLERIPLGEIKLEGIYYDYDKADIRPESEVTLQKLLKFLVINNNIVVELSSHTDSRGNDDYNMVLSGKRAQSVVNWLVTHGIDTERLKPVGYGESRPVAKNAQTEEEHQLNRRTSIEVIGENYVAKKKN